ncbi:wax ester synthase/diacylglycerol acyltransferase 3 isoform X3 [Brassica napus]|nr:wax ester synthase/diacylglycerol acyltransferase 3 isoform X3 [Brassica napus]
MKKGKYMASEEEEERGTEEPLSPVSRLLSSPELCAVIVVTLGLKTRCNISSVVAGIKESLIKLPRFSCKLDMDSKNKKKGEPVWVPVRIQVESHVIVPDLDHVNLENPEDFIEDYCSTIANTSMDMSIPPWEFHVLNLKTSNAESVGIVKFHHSLGDGMSLMSLLLACSRKTSDPNALPTIAATTKKHQKSNDKGWWFIGSGFWYMIRFIFINFVEVFKFVLTLCFLRDTKSDLSSEFMDGIQPKKVIHRIINFDDVKLVKNIMQMKVNDVLLGMTQAGLSRYLSRKYADEDTTTEKKKVLDRIHLRGTVAVNLRPYTKIQDLDNVMTKGAKCTWGNFVGLVIFPLWIRSEDDPLEYVRQAKATMDKKKLSLEAFNFYGVIKLNMKFFGEKVVQAISKRLFDHTTLTYSNMMGPDEEISIFDQPISYLAASALTGSQVLNIHFVSYVNKLTISLAVDATVIPDPHRLCDDLVESLNIIKSTALEKFRIS